MTSKEVERWYHQWMKEKNKTGIVATVNVLDMLKDFAAFINNNKQVLSDEEKADLIADILISYDLQKSDLPKGKTSYEEYQTKHTQLLINIYNDKIKSALNTHSEENQKVVHQNIFNAENYCK